jgi:hypothetical protein
MVREVLEADDPSDPSLRRLFPAADEDDPEHAADFDRLTRPEITEGRLAALRTMERTLGHPVLSEEELTDWLAAINDGRLILGVRLQVDDEGVPNPDVAGDPERFAADELYRFLAILEGHIVRGLSGISEWSFAGELVRREAAREHSGRRESGGDRDSGPGR